MLLRLRPPVAGARLTPRLTSDERAPITLFMPARNEAPRVGDVIRRCPDTVHGHPVRCVVIDDASEDDTAAVARAAGAEVISLDWHCGLGAGVRVGLADGVAHGSAAVVFCDADGEYAPEELPDLVAPILDGSADYVIGSRFLRDDARMLAHRRFGNRVLTVLLRAISRVPLTDGQSGYRALSPAAAATAEIIHDYNYAQVLTLDLLGKGATYREVPITYAFRTSGRSFVRLGRYLRRVGPAVFRELNTLHAPGVSAVSLPAPGGAERASTTTGLRAPTQSDDTLNRLGERVAG